MGEVVAPTGLVQIIDTVQGRYVGSVVATYGPIRNGQRVLPAEKFTPSGQSHAVAVTEGVHAKFLGGPGPAGHEGAADGGLPRQGSRGRGRPGRPVRDPAHGRSGCRMAASSINDVMATMQVVHVREHSATAKLLNILSPDIAPGTDARQVAKLPS